MHLVKPPKNAKDGFLIDLDVATAQLQAKSGLVTPDIYAMTVDGKAEPGSTVTVYVDGVPVGTVVADANGNWSFTTPPLADTARYDSLRADSSADDTVDATPEGAGHEA